MLKIDSKPVYSSSKSFIVSDNLDLNPDLINNTFDLNKFNPENNNSPNPNNNLKFTSKSDLYVSDFINKELEQKNERNIHYKMIKEDLKQFKPQIINGQLIDKLDLRSTPLTRLKPVDTKGDNDELYQ